MQLQLHTALLKQLHWVLSTLPKSWIACMGRAKVLFHTTPGVKTLDLDIEPSPELRPWTLSWIQNLDPPLDSDPRTHPWNQTLDHPLCPPQTPTGIRPWTHPSTHSCTHVISPTVPAIEFQCGAGAEVLGPLMACSVSHGVRAPEP